MKGTYLDTDGETSFCTSEFIVKINYLNLQLVKAREVKDDVFHECNSSDYNIFCHPRLAGVLQVVQSCQVTACQNVSFAHMFYRFWDGGTTKKVNKA